MTLAEFKAWFEGYTESMDGTPTAKQWKRIKSRVDEIDGQPITERIFIDRYYPHYPTWTPTFYSILAAAPDWGASAMSAVGIMDATSDSVNVEID